MVPSHSSEWDLQFDTQQVISILYKFDTVAENMIFLTSGQFFVMSKGVFERYEKTKATVILSDTYIYNSR